MLEHLLQRGAHRDHLQDFTLTHTPYVGQLALRNVAGNAGKAEHFISIVAQRHFSRQQPALSARRVDHMFLVIDQRLPRSDDLLLVREKLFSEFGRMELEIRLANQVGGSREADLHSGRIVRDDEAACRVLDPDIVGKPVNQRLQRNDFVDRLSLGLFFLIRA